MSPRPSKRTSLLRAATTVVAERGYSALTLDAVGAATGVSKGGVLYHFPTKEELAIGFDSDQSAAYDADSTAPGAWTRAYLTASDAPTDDESDQLAVVALLAAIGYNPSLLAPIQDRYREIRADERGLRDRLADGAAKARAVATPMLGEMYDRMGFLLP